MVNSYLNPLTEHVYWTAPDAKRDRPIMGAVVGQRSTLIVEAGASPANAAQFREALSALGGAPTRYVAVTHWHWDHVFGIHAMDLPTIAHRETRRRVAEMAALDWRDAALNARVASGQEYPFIADHMKVEMSDEERASLVIQLPDVIIDDQLEIDLGGVTVQIIHVGGDHAPDSSVVYIPEDGVVFLGDCLYNGSLRGRPYYTVQSLYPLVDTLLGLKAEKYLFAHEEKVYTRSDFEKEARLFRQAGDVVAETGNRKSALERLSSLTGEPVNEDQEFCVDAFLTGLKVSGEA